MDNRNILYCTVNVIPNGQQEYLILYSEYDTEWTTEESGFYSSNNMRFFVISEEYKSAPETIQHPIQCVPAAISFGNIAECVCATDHALSSNGFNNLYGYKLNIKRVFLN